MGDGLGSGYVFVVETITTGDRQGLVDNEEGVVREVMVRR